jgi:hypothetical protein
MPVGSRRRSPTWQQSLLLLLFGAVVGYFSFVNLSIWGGSVSRYQGLYLLGFFVGAVAFLSGFASFLAIAARAVTSPTESRPAIDAPPRASTGATSRAAPAKLAPGAAVKLRASVPSGAAAVLTRLRITLVAVVTLACLAVLQDWGRPPLTSSYGRYYWLNAALTLLLSQLPYAIALLRTWNVPDRAGLALAIVASATQVLVTFFPPLQYTAVRLAPWSWLRALFALAAAVFACLAWRPFFSRKGDAGLLISMIFGFLAYTWIAQISLAILDSRELRWISR